MRDLDVLSGRLEDHSKEPQLWSVTGNEATVTARQKKLAEEAQQLDAHLKKRREHEARALARQVDRHRRDLTAALEDLLSVLRTEPPVTLSSDELVALAHRWFARQLLHGHLAHGRVAANDEALHDLRKAAKLVRYLLESAAGDSERARNAAAEFEAVQEVGGRWHDLLTLTDEPGPSTSGASPASACECSRRRQMGRDKS